MADEEKNEQTEEKPEGDAPEEQAPPEESKAEEKSADEAPAEEPAEGGSKEDEAPAGGGDEKAAAEKGAAAEDASPDEGSGDEEGMDWKARRRLERSRQPSEARPQQSPADRAAERAQGRAAAAKARSSYRRKRREGGEAGTGTPAAERRSVARKIRQGRVVSDKADKTITIRIDVARRHPAYEKIVRTSNTLHAHDERNEAGEGDLVRVVETRPLSRTKRWRLVEVLEKAK